MDERTTPNEATADADRKEASTKHQADGPVTSEEEEAADRAREDPELGDMEEVGTHYREMTQRGVDEKGEGRIE